MSEDIGIQKDLDPSIKRGKHSNVDKDGHVEEINPDGSTNVKYADSSILDSFNRIRISQPLTIFDSKQIFDNQPLLWDESLETGAGITSAHSTDTASTVFTSTLNTAGKFTRQTFMRFNYQPGKSQLVMMTGVLGAGTAGITQEIGLHDDDNGLFFRCDQGTLKVVRKTSVTGSAVDNAVAQSSWNLDKLDGTGESGIDLDFTKTQIFIIDFEWLGVGRVRMGLVHNGEIVYSHEFLNSNVLADVYMSTPNLPLRYSIENDGTGSAISLKQICSTVISEGGSEDLGVLRHISTQGTHVDCNVENTLYAIIGIKLKSTHLAASVKLKKVAIQIQTASETGEWELLLNPTVADTFAYSDVTNSAIQKATGATANTVTGGTNIDGGFAQSFSGGGGSGDATEEVDNAILLGSKIDGTPDEIVLCWRPTGGTSSHDIEGSIHYRELT